MEFLSVAIESVAASIPAIFEVAFAAIALASAITALTPTPRDDIFVGKIYKILEAVALNVGAAKQVAPNRLGGRFVAG
ncbi:hypothetical protein [Rubrimonas cliftonensis]|uniref:Uncharacterized protein n=1 Tax=Rubrimonas cliftonensis TaxID=89524 RepID=A0A1H3ZG29_9RHOB|nr:hypothetical protein [Rubrimonas cliftonensis]SEA22726.1 hypothetical protein SAMN05444370_103528 [Rubrimonas cliftonensis]